MLAANLANFGRIGVIYNKSLEQALVIFPALLAALITVAGGVPTDEGGKLDFKIHLQDPPACSTGFIPPPLIRSPGDTTVRDLPPDLYCKVPHNDPSVVRGARNYPCQEFPGKRAPTIQLCRDPRGYVPIGTNPWRGPPVPIGEPITDGRNILPPNKFPYIPPQVDPDPGPPVVQLPPGVPPGPGPAPHAPYPLPVPPNEPGTPPPPWPFFAPPDQVVPPYGRTPPGPGRAAAAATAVHRHRRRAAAARGSAAAGQWSERRDVRPEHRCVRGSGRRDWRVCARCCQTGACGELGRPDDGSKAGVMSEDTASTTEEMPKPRARRRASRPAGPVNGVAADTPATATIETASSRQGPGGPSGWSSAAPATESQAGRHRRPGHRVRRGRRTCRGGGRAARAAAARRGRRRPATSALSTRRRRPR